MNLDNVYLEIDVDYVRQHGCALNPSTGEMLDYCSRPTGQELVAGVDKLQENFGEEQLKHYNEALYLAFSPQRMQQEHGHD